MMGSSGSQHRPDAAFSRRSGKGSRREEIIARKIFTNNKFFLYIHL